MTPLPDCVGDIMTRDVATLNENDSLAHLQASLGALRFRHLPVTDGERLIGLVSDRDILGVSASNLSPHRLEQDRLLMDRFAVRDVMTTKVVTVSPRTPILEAGRLMLSHRISCLPVVDDTNMLKGIVTSSDFIRLFVEHLAERA
jgi:acetoin utilization protein AcuB